MFLLERLLRTLGYCPTPRLSFHTEQALLDSLQELADEEQRPREQVMADLLAQGLARRQVAQVHLRRWQALSAREQQVAALVCLNYTNRQIGLRLSISPETVKSHVRNLLAKFELHTKAELRHLLADWDFSAWEK
jgi:DNA-binding CsgD family transcriptional regulator